MRQTLYKSSVSAGYNLIRKKNPIPECIDFNRNESPAFQKQPNGHLLNGGAILGTQCRFLLMAGRHLAAATANSALEPMLLGLCIAFITAIIATPFTFPLCQH